MTDDATAFLDRAFDALAAGQATAGAENARRAAALTPAAPLPLILLGAALAQNGEANAAAQALRRAVAIHPANAAARAQLALALLQADDTADAERQARLALTLRPDDADASEALGLLAYRRGDYATAVGLLLRAHRLRPAKTETLLNLGAALRDARLFDAAETVFGAAISRRPDLREGWLGRAVTRLVRGDLKNGWEDFEHRWKRPMERPEWDGRRLNGETLLIRAEQGFGDAIQFARFAPLAADRGARVALEVHPALVRLLRRLDPRVEIHPSDRLLPPFDLHCPIMSLARLFGATLDNLPAPPFYLTPEPLEAAKAAAAVKAATEGAETILNVGLCWAGNPAHKNDHNRSIPAAALADLLNTPGVAFWSLQTGAAATALPADLASRLRPPPFPLIDFAATAALIAALDAVVTVDTSIAHLSGALGVPGRVLLPYAPDWRWLVDRADSPWHPSLRLIRQQRPGDWSGVVRQASALLAGAARDRVNPSP